jgi:hypothetical protein
MRGVAARRSAARPWTHSEGKRPSLLPAPRVCSTRMVTAYPTWAASCGQDLDEFFDIWIFQQSKPLTW